MLPLLHHLSFFLSFSFFQTPPHHALLHLFPSPLDTFCSLIHFLRFCYKLALSHPDFFCSSSFIFFLFPVTRCNKLSSSFSRTLRLILAHPNPSHHRISKEEMEKFVTFPTHHLKVSVFRIQANINDVFGWNSRRPISERKRTM